MEDWNSYAALPPKLSGMSVMSSPLFLMMAFSISISGCPMDGSKRYKEKPLSTQDTTFRSCLIYNISRLCTQTTAIRTSVYEASGWRKADILQLQ